MWLLAGALLQHPQHARVVWGGCSGRSRLFQGVPVCRKAPASVAGCLIYTQVLVRNILAHVGIE